MGIDHDSYAGLRGHYMGLKEPVVNSAAGKWIAFEKQAAVSQSVTGSDLICQNSALFIQVYDVNYANEGPKLC